MMQETEFSQKMSWIYSLKILRLTLLTSSSNSPTTVVLEAEIRCLSRATIFSDYMIVDGKSGRRIVRLASQARKILNQNPQWDYTANYIQLTWRRNVKKLGLEDARMHDLRRTFGYNLIKQGRPIYEVSKLLGHSSVTTTERHYAPLMATEIEEFIL